jgi:antitoxin component YwqK of YwqJK toxin-antitoxin module
LTQWYENGKGQKRLEKTFKDGRENGYWASWDENGLKMEEGNYKNAKEDGNWTFWYANGQKKRDGTFKNGEMISIECWDEDGNECECGFLGCK